MFHLVEYKHFHYVCYGHKLSREMDGFSGRDYFSILLEKQLKSKSEELNNHCNHL